MPSNINFCIPNFNIKVDWDKWVEEDELDDNDDNDNSNFDLGNMFYSLFLDF